MQFRLLVRETEMTDVQVELSQLVSTFMAGFNELARRVVLETLEAALKENTPEQASAALLLATSRKDGAIAPKTLSAPRATSRPAPKATGARASGAKRTPDELEKLTDRLLRCVTDHPGLRIEDVNKKLGTSTKDVAGPMRKLVVDGAVHTTGVRRATQYFPGSAGGAKGRAKKSSSK